MRERLAVIHIVLYLLMVACLLGVLAIEVITPDAPAPVCQEDQPCWDWRTMGNRSAGFHINDIEACPGQEPGPVIVVNLNDGVPCKRAAY